MWILIVLGFGGTVWVPVPGLQVQGVAGSRGLGLHVGSIVVPFWDYLIGS